MTAPTVLDKASGALGTAIAARIVRDFSGVDAFAKRIGYSPWSVWRWVQNDIAPSQEGAECLVALYPELQPLLEAKGCYKRKTLPLGKGAETTKQSQVRIEAARREAAGFAAVHLLPWPSEGVKAARRHVVVALAKQRAAAARASRTATTQVVKKTMPRRPLRVSRSGDFIERMDEMTVADVRFTPSYEMEDSR